MNLDLGLAFDVWSCAFIRQVLRSVMLMGLGSCAVQQNPSAGRVRTCKFSAATSQKACSLGIVVYNASIFSRRLGEAPCYLGYAMIQ